MAKKNISLDLDAVVETVEETAPVVVENKITNPVDDKPVVKYCTVVNCDRLRVREEPSETGRVLTIVEKGTKLIFKNKKDATWTHVQTQTGHDGYVMSKYIKKDQF